MDTTQRTLTAALIGDPNTGKSTFFNAWTGLRQVTGNWPGVTVEKLTGDVSLPTGETLTVVDLPGIYSLHAVSEDERVATNYVRRAAPDVIINIVDAVNLERNLYLTLALMELGKPMVIVLSMTDILERQGFRVNMVALSQRLGIPVISAHVQRRATRVALERAVLEALATKQHLVQVAYPDALQQALQRAHHEGEPAFHAIHRLEGILPGAEAIIDDVEQSLGTTPDVLIADARYAKIAELTHGIVRQVGHARTEVGRTLDRFVLNRWLGVPIFLGVMYLLFWVTQVVGGCFIDFFDGVGDALFVTGLGNLLTLWGAPQWAITLLADGLGTGVQTVMTFIPPVFFIFLGLSLLEDSGYMARAAYVMDRVMRLLGLPGSAFVPMLVGFGCTVPAIMATRTLSNRRDRLLTIFMTPFMSCGARLPVYALFGAAFFGIASGTMVFAIYLCGILLAVLTGILLKHTLFVGEPAPFILELPLYHIPRLTSVFKQAWERLQRFLFRAGQVLVVMVLLLSLCDKITLPNPYTKSAEKVSVIELVGRTIAPVFVPMGLSQENWQGSVALIVGLFAKEQVISSLNTLYAIEAPAVKNDGAEAESLTWSHARHQLTRGLLDACATIPLAIGDLLDKLFDPLGINIFKSDYQQALDIAQALADPTLSPQQLARLQTQLDTALDIDGLHLALTEATATKEALEKQIAQNKRLHPQLETAEDELEATARQLEKASTLQMLAKRITSGAAATPDARQAALAAFEAQINSYYQSSISEEIDADTSLMRTLAEKFNHDKHRAFAYLLFVLLYVPCLAAMATVVREIGWGYSAILVGYLTLLGWCVATLYFQITSAHQFLWIAIPCGIFAAIIATFYALGKYIRVRMIL